MHKSTYISTHGLNFMASNKKKYAYIPHKNAAQMAEREETNYKKRKLAE